MNDYRRLEAEAKKPTQVVDHRAKLEQLPALADCNGQVEQRVRLFCESKRISWESLLALDTRVKVDRNGGVELAWPYPAQLGGREIITAIKFRSLDGEKKRYAETPSTFLEPLVIGQRQSLDWFAAEGETDACRLFDWIGDAAAVMVLPAGARTFKPEWAARVPRGAIVHLCHDADAAGEVGAEKAARILGGKTVRMRPPDGTKDWCEWQAGRDEFIALVRTARASRRQYEFCDLDEFLQHPFPQAEPLLGEPGQTFLAVGSLLLVYGADGSAKSTWSVDGIAHMAAGQPWLGIPVERPVRFLVIENEGPPKLFQEKLADKAATWEGPSWSHNVTTFKHPWGAFSFADADARSALTSFCDEHNIDVVVANPTLGLGVAGSGRPDETQQFMDWLVECGLKSKRAFWLLHHENKAGQISGDWGRHPDTKVQLQADGNQPRTKLTWEKTRWAVLPTEEQPKSCLLEWIVETKGYRAVELPAGATDSELEARIDAYLAEHPLSSTTGVLDNVQGTRDKLRKLLQTSPKYDSVKGARGASQWFLRSDPAVDPADRVTE
jgi:hypothetical protein